MIIDLILIAFFLCFCDFANWAPSGLKTVLLRLILIFQKFFFRIKIPKKCLQTMFYYTYSFQKKIISLTFIFF